MKTKRIIATMLVIVMLFQTVSLALTADDFSDFPQEGHWSYPAMENALKNGLLQGKGDGIIAPTANLTRAEFAAVVTRAFGAKKVQSVDHLVDIGENDWFYKDNSIAKAYRMGVMNGTGEETFSPNLNMRREDVFLTLARALFVQGDDEIILSKFEDASNVDSWALNAMIGMVDQEYVNGYHDETNDVWTLKPRDSITREELAQVFHNLFKYYISDYDITEENKGVFGGTDKNNIKSYDGSVVVRTPGVTLQYANIDGDLIIADGVGEGKFTLKGTHVTGNIIVRGGESEEVNRYISFINVTCDGDVIVNNVNGTVHFNNYRTDKPFADSLVERTPATFLERTGGGVGGGSVGSTCKYTIQYYLEDLDEEGKFYLGDEKAFYVERGTVVYPFEVAGNDINGFELYPEKSNHELYYEGVKIKSNNHNFKIYYTRNSYTVKFDGISEETYKYGYKLTLEDIPEDDEVTVPAGMQFMGWATEPDQTAGTSREDLVGIEIKEGLTYYPAFAELGAVEYKIYHYFEALDGSYPEADRVEKTESAKPATEVTAEKLTGTDLPEGFEYFAHDDEVLEGTVPSDGTILELYVYYNRLTYTVKFDGISEETYKYGYKLTLDDIPEDEDVPVEDHEKFIGWATDPEAKTGVDRTELVDTEVTDELVYYPVIVDKDLVEYYVEHYFEDLELDENGDPTYSLYDTEEFYGKIGTSVVAEEIDVEGFSKITHDNQLLSGQIPKEEDGVLTLRIYYNRVLVEVEFYDPTGDYYDDVTMTYSQPNAVVQVRYGTKPDDQENLDKYIAAESDPESNGFVFDRGYENGFERKTEYSGEYFDLSDDERIYKIPLFWWYEDDESGEFKKFYQEGVESDLVFTADVDVYGKAKKISITLEAPDFDYPAFYDVFYDDDTRLLDTVKNAIFRNVSAVQFDLEYAGIEDKVYEKFSQKGVFNKVGDKYEITNFNKLVRFTRLMGEQAFEDFLESFIDDSAVTSLEDFLFDYIITHDVEETAAHLKEMVDELIVGHEDIAREMMHDLAVDLIEKEVSHVEEFFMTYTTSLVEANNTKDLEKMICEMFADYKGTNETEFVAFVSDALVKAISEDTPNADIVAMIEDYIKSEIKKGTYDDEIIDYILDMSDDEFMSAATSVIKEDVSIIEGDVEDKILTDDSFVETIIDEIFDLDSDTVDNEIKQYIKDYNLADNYIKDNPEAIVDYITDDQIFEFSDMYIHGVTLTRQEKLDALTQFIADDPDAVAKLKNYAGASNLNTLIGDYYDDNKDTVKSEMKTEVVTNPNLRNELADFAMSLINDDEFGDLLDFAIDNYLADVLADEDKKRALAEEEVDRLSNDKIYNLAFVQDAIDTVVDDVIADIKANEEDGDDSTESEYVAEVKKYVKSLNNFSDIVDSLVHADEEFRNEIIVKLFNNLYATDPDHSIILEFMEKVTNKMIEEADVDVNILVTIIDYIRDMGDHGHALTNDIIENLMKLGDDLVSYVEDNLGWIDNSGKLEASLKFKKEATYEEKFEVTAFNDEFIMDKVEEKVKEMTFDAFMEEYVYAKLPADVSRSMVEKLPLEIIENIYNRSHDDFKTSLHQARENVRNGMTDQWVYSGFFVSVNPIVDVVVPMHEYAMKGYDAAIAKAESIGGRAGEIYTSFYMNNPYINDIIALFDMDYKTYENNFLEGTANSSYEPSSGFYIRSLGDIYQDVLMPGSVLGDDMFVWYLERVDFSKIRGLAEDNEDLILAMYNHPNVLAERYAEEGLPESIEDYYHDLMEDPDIKDAFNKIDNKVSFEMEPFFMRFLTNETVEMYYYKGLEKFGMKADVILDKYEGAETKKEITSENFAAMLDELEYCWKDGNIHATTDYAFDGGLKNLFSIVSFSKGLKGYTITFERGLVDR